MLRVFIGQGDARKLLARSVQLVWGLDHLPEISRLPEGKPVFFQYSDYHFNLSHSGSLVLCALADHPVGADIEIVRPRSPEFPAYVLKGTEYDRYLTLGGDWNAFYTLWTEKESIVKYTGEGLKAWRRAQVPVGCVMTNLSGEGWRGAVCAHETAENLQELFMES